MNIVRKTKIPNPVDQRLESRGYYRKHTARDSTCLFRVFSEQLFLTQRYHEKVRADCVMFMRDNLYLFDKDFDQASIENYLEAMSGLNEFGGPLEIKAMSKLYHCEVFVFEGTSEPVNVTNNGFSKKILMFNDDKHYDSVFYKSYIQTAAYCQSLVYETLYERVFKLPDVQYAVSKMLHEASGESKTEEDSLDQRNTQNWIDNELDADPLNTYCVLEDVSKCMFHNKNEKTIIFRNEQYYGNIDEFDNANKNQKESKNLKKSSTLKNIEGSRSNLFENAELATTNNRIEKYNASMIPEFVARLLNIADFHATDSSISCVKQMLKQNLTPFPYKVAKALDVEVYRNIEFDTWNEAKRETRYGNWYTGGTNLQVGVKCLVKISENQLTWYHCHIQEMPESGEPCVVFVEELGEKRTVPRDFLQPLPIEEVKPWALPYRHYRNWVSSLHNSKLFSFAEYSNKIKKIRVCKSRNNCKNSIDQNLVNKDNSQDLDHTINIQEGKMGTDFKKINKLQAISSLQSKDNDSELFTVQRDIGGSSNIGHSKSTNAILNNEVQSSYHNNQSFSNSCPYCYVCPINQSPWNNIQSQNCDANSNCEQGLDQQQIEIVEPVQYVDSHETVSAFLYQPTIQYFVKDNCRMDNCLHEPINFSASKSILYSGEDLPLNDTPTLRFFYNLGVDYFNSSCIVKQPFIELNQEGIMSSGKNGFENYDCNNPDEFCANFQTSLLLDSNMKQSNRSFIENNHSGRPNGLKILSEKPIECVSSENLNNTIIEVVNGETQPSAASFMAGYTQVPGMYSTMVPCYPIEEGGNLYMAQYMGMSFGVVPQTSEAQGDSVQDQSFNSVLPSQVIYQPNTPMPFVLQSIPGSGYYQDQVWYHTPNAISTQSLVVPGHQDNNFVPYTVQTPSPTPYNG